MWKILHPRTGTAQTALFTRGLWLNLGYTGTGGACTGIPVCRYRYTGIPVIKTFEDPFSSVLKPIFETQVSFEICFLCWNIFQALQDWHASALPTFAQFFVGIFWAVFPGFFLLGILTFAPLQDQHLQFFASFRNITVKLKILKSRWIFIKMI